jgi:hypothetical protein
MLENQTPVNCEMSKSELTYWPFPIMNNQRTPESQKLLNTKHFPKQKDDLSDCEESPF